MNRVAACAFVLICAAPLACQSTQHAMSPGWDGTCTSFGKTATAKVEVTVVSGSLVVIPECVLIVKNQSNVEWIGPANMKLQVQFKPGLGSRPTNPTCTAGTSKCTLAMANASKTGFFNYNVIVTPPGQQPIPIDPRLIIQP